MAHTRYLTSCLLGFHGLFVLCLVLGMIQSVSATPPSDDQVESLLAELASGDVKGNAFKLFIQRAQLVITGLMHISILLLPKHSEESSGNEPNPAPTGSSSKSGRGGSTGASTSHPNGGASSSKSSGGGEASSSTPAPGFPADGSDLEAWQTVQRALERTASSGLDWDNCCVYKLDEKAGAAIQPAPPYPVSSTAGYYVAKVKKDAIICSTYEKGPHFADWQALHSAGARSIAAAPMFAQDRLIGVLNLASSEPHAFDRSRWVWLLALALAPFANALRYTTKALQIDAFVMRIMPPLLEQNYVRNMTEKAGTTTAAAGAAGGTGGSSSPTAAASSTNGSSHHASESARNTSPRSSSKPGSVPIKSVNGKTTAVGSNQFAEHAEVLISGAGKSATSLVAPPPGCDPGGECEEESDGHGDTSTSPFTTNTNTLHLKTTSTVHVNGNVPPVRGGGAKGHKGSKGSDKVPSGGHVKITHPPLSSTDGKIQVTSSLQSAGSGVIQAHRPSSPNDTPDNDLDWGDFMFNLASMCIVYAYFSEAAVAGESQAAVVASMFIAAVDIALLALRWLWYEQYITHGGTVLQIFQMYRVVVLPVANTWMSWSLLNKLGIRPGTMVISALGGVVVLFLVLGVQVRSFLHAPLQLASVVFAAATTTDLCSALFGGVFGLRCMGVMSLMQLSLGVVVPSLLVHVLEMRNSGQKPYLPHVQAKRWLLHG